MKTNWILIMALTATGPLAAAQMSPGALIRCHSSKVMDAGYSYAVYLNSADRFDGKLSENGMRNQKFETEEVIIEPKAVKGRCSLRITQRSDKDDKKIVLIVDHPDELGMAKGELNFKLQGAEVSELYRPQNCFISRKFHERICGSGKPGAKNQSVPAAR